MTHLDGEEDRVKKERGERGSSTTSREHRGGCDNGTAVPGPGLKNCER